jgi:uncharacterized membrane protein
VTEWLHLVLRWLHVIAGVFWLGQTALFTWLDARLRAEARDGKEQIWMVHSGGFYVVDRQTAPAALDMPLHWFKWEAAITWATGFALLVQLYWLGGALNVAGGRLSDNQAIALSAAVLLGGWTIYDLLWTSPLRRNERVLGALCYLAVVALSWGLAQYLSGRGSYLQIGALFGTLMAANVWMRILPAQRRMVAAIGRGEAADPRLAAIAKQRSKHNTFMALPLLFIMISPHFPVATYGHRYNWLILAVLMLAGFALRALINWHEGKR